MKVIGRILNAEDTVPFAAAHGFKRELDNAIGTAWDRSVKSQVTNISKTLRGTLRDALSVHEPYNAATKAYEAIAPLYTKGFAPALRKTAVDNPGAVVSLISPKQPEKVRMLRDLLVAQSEKGGGGRMGQTAWDNVRSAWTHQNLLGSGIKKLGANLAKLDPAVNPEFTDVMYGDASGKAVLDNLQKINAAYKSALTSGKASIAQAIEQGEANKVATKKAGARLVASNMANLMGTKEEAGAFAKSTVGKLYKEDVLADMMRAGFLGPKSIWGALSISRLLRGPKAGDLLQYAAYSPRGTQLMIDLFTSPAPGVAATELLRMTGLVDLSEGTKKAGVGQPPPVSTVPLRAQGPGPNVGVPPQ